MKLLWNNLSFDTTCFVKLKEENIKAKCNALKKYKSQEDRKYMNEKFIFSHSYTRGIQAGCEYAESF
jgi:N-acetylglucosamine malate deacetylase 1